MPVDKVTDLPSFVTSFTTKPHHGSPYSTLTWSKHPFGNYPNRSQLQLLRFIFLSSSVCHVPYRQYCPNRQVSPAVAPPNFSPPPEPPKLLSSSHFLYLREYPCTIANFRLFQMTSTVTCSQRWLKFALRIETLLSDELFRLTRVTTRRVHPVLAL